MVKTLNREQLTTLQPDDLAWDDIPADVWRDLPQRSYETVCLQCARPFQLPGTQLGAAVDCPGCRHAQTIEWAAAA
jgi:DNA-directed RNA polymerase subunit RPC12/RpoP